MKLLPAALPGLFVTGLLVVSCIPSVDEEEPGTPDGSTGDDGSGGSGSGGFTSSSGGASTASGGVVGSGGASSSASGGVSGSGGLAVGSGGTTGAAGRSGGGNVVPTGGRSGLGGRSAAGGGRTGAGGRNSATGAGGRGGRAGTAGSSGTATATFAEVAQILGTSCGVTNCHSDMTHTDLRSDAGLYARLVNAAPTGTATMAACKTMKLVTPNSPSTSVLSQIVKAAVTGCSPARMPDTCSTNGLPRACLSAAQISTIDGWISGGARM